MSRSFESSPVPVEELVPLIELSPMPTTRGIPQKNHEADRLAYLDRIGQAGDIYTYLMDRRPPEGWLSKKETVTDATSGTIVEFPLMIPMAADE